MSHPTFWQRWQHRLTGRGHQPAAWQLYREFQHTLTLIQDLDQVAINLVGKAGEILGTPSVHLALWDEDGSRYRVRHSLAGWAGHPFTLDARDALVRWLEINQTTLRDLPRNGVWHTLSAGTRELLAGLDIQLVMPVSGLNRLLAILLAAPPSPPSAGFDPEAVEILVSLSPQIGLALENSFLYRERRDRIRRMTRADRLATVGMLAAGAAHEIRNPLTAIKSTLQFAVPRQPDETTRRLLGQALEETGRIEKILSGLLSFARQGEMRREPVSLPAILTQALELIAFQARQQKVAIQVPPAFPDLWIEGDSAQLTQLFLNLLLNAIQAMPEGGTLSVEASRPRTGATICIADTGPGIPSSQLDQIFDPFFTTKKDGTGLGLSICFGIVRRHGGEIEVDSTPGSGTRMLVHLPVRTGTGEENHV